MKLGQTPTFEHYLLTRWNLGIYSRAQKTVGGGRIDPEQWMVSRFRLWEKYCVPSVFNQTCQNFTWLVVFDPATPRHYVERATAILHPKHEILFANNFRQGIKVRIGKPTVDRLITSRLDNDDALHVDYIKKIQERFLGRTKTGLYVFPTGWIWNPRKRKLYHCRYLRNPFLTLVEKPQTKVHTVLAHRHTKIGEMFKVHRLEGGHRWVQIIHGENLANYCHGDRVDEKLLVEGEYWG